MSNAQGAVLMLGITRATPARESSDDLVRLLFNEVSQVGSLSDDAWLAFQQSHPMPADQREAVLLATVQGLCRLCADTTVEAHRLAHALHQRTG